MPGGGMPGGGMPGSGMPGGRMPGGGMPGGGMPDMGAAGTVNDCDGTTPPSCISHNAGLTVSLLGRWNGRTR